MLARTHFRPFWLAICIFFLITGCADESPIIPSKISTDVTRAKPLSYSGVLVIGAPEIPWTGQSGVLVFTVVRNHSESDWRGYPIAAAYQINSNRTRGELISTGQGVLTSFVDRQLFTPTNELKYIPGNDEREALTFIPVDFSVHPLVYVYWRFVEEGSNEPTFGQEVRNPKALNQMTLSEARKLISD